MGKWSQVTSILKFLPIKNKRESVGGREREKEERREGGSGREREEEEEEGGGAEGNPQTLSCLVLTTILDKLSRTLASDISENSDNGGVA